jgi:hypothetical protein
VQVALVERHNNPTTVYNFVVEDTHTYFVGTANGGVWVHNDCVSLYRSVSPGEMADIQNTGMFRMGPNSSMGKWFAENPADAAEWGRALGNDGGVVGATMPRTIADQMFRLDRLDNIGPARYADPEHLQFLTPVLP